MNSSSQKTPKTSVIIIKVIFNSERIIHKSAIFPLKISNYEINDM